MQIVTSAVHSSPSLFSSEPACGRGLGTLGCESACEAWSTSSACVSATAETPAGEFASPVAAAAPSEVCASLFAGVASDGALSGPVHGVTGPDARAVRPALLVRLPSADGSLRLRLLAARVVVSPEPSSADAALTRRECTRGAIVAHSASKRCCCDDCLSAVSDMSAAPPEPRIRAEERPMACGTLLPCVTGVDTSKGRTLLSI